ncbi:hypothetical protein LCGC14_0958330 [marine sediment metagenome]|uniref:Uncharacterized protein n=1 Tax=marine sediment metagenome TaxID=412755 RepID=A0A0F9P1B8_9ZZZZ
MAKKILELKIEVESDVEAYFVVNKITQLNFLSNIKVKEAKYNGKTHLFDSNKKRKGFLKGKTEKD